MTYSKETISKAIELLRSRIEHFKSLDDIKVVISKGNNKIGNTLNVSLAPVITCPNCSKCVAYCYDIKAVMLYKNVLDARAKNTALLMTNRSAYFEQIRSELKKRKKNKCFRWHVSGDIIDMDYFDNMVKIAKDFPDFRFWTYTKSYWFVNAWCKENGKENIPDNLSVMFSYWEGLPMDNPYNFPEFRVVLKGQNKPENVKWCCGNCNVCIRNCSHCVKGETTYCMEH